MSTELETINNIINELEKIENRDLLFAFLNFDKNRENTPEKSFIVGFSNGFGDIMDFETYANFVRNLESHLKDTLIEIEETVNISKSYDDYLLSQEATRSASGLTDNQAKRFDALMDKHDDGWSGAYYGHLCRKVEAHLRQKYINNN